MDSPNARPLEHVEGEIEFRDVTFTYDEKKKAVLEHINLHVRPGEMLALVGPSGGGRRL